MIRERAPAKVNLILQVGPRRADGLHDICSLFASLDLADELTLLASDTRRGPRALRGSDRREPRRVRPARLPRARGPPAASARRADREADSARGRARRRQRRRRRRPARRQRAGRRAAGCRGAARARGRGGGRRAEPDRTPPRACDGCRRASGAAGAAGDGSDAVAEQARACRRPRCTARPTGSRSTREQLEPDRLRELAAGPLEALAAALANDLQPAALSLRPELQDGIDALLEAGALAAGLSGSGPTAFGVFSGPAEAERAASSVMGAVATRLRAS